MGKKKKTHRDTVEIARSVVEQAIGERLSGEPLQAEQLPPDGQGPRPDESTSDSDEPQTPE